MINHNINYRQKNNINSWFTNCYVNVICLFFIIFANCNSHAQNLDSLLIDYQAKEILHIDSICNAQKLESKYKWLNLLPSASYNVSSNSFNVGINLNSFANYYQQKKRNKIEIQKLRSQLLQRLDNRLISLQTQITEYQNQVQTLEFEQQQFAIAEELHAINSKKYENNQITLVAFLNSKSKFLNAKKSLYAFKNQLDIQLQKILQVLKFSL